MATSSKRFIIIMIFLDLMLLMAMGFYNGNDNPANEISQYSTGLGNVTEGGSQFHTTTIDEGEEYIAQYGDSIAGFDSLSKVFRIKFKDNQIDCPDCPDPDTANTLSWVIGLFYGIVHLLALFEIIMLVVNKKQD